MLGGSTKTGRYDIAKILLKVELSTKNQSSNEFFVETNSQCIITRKLFKSSYNLNLKRVFMFIVRLSWQSALLVEETGGTGRKPPNCRKSLTIFIT